MAQYRPDSKIQFIFEVWEGGKWIFYSLFLHKLFLKRPLSKVESNHQQESPSWPNGSLLMKIGCIYLLLKGHPLDTGSNKNLSQLFSASS